MIRPAARSELVMHDGEKRCGASKADLPPESHGLAEIRLCCFLPLRLKHLSL
jgi:hypothetical protein